MLAGSHDEVIDLDALLDLYAATARQAVLDLRRGPGCSDKQWREYQTARQFLERVGVLDRVVAHYGLTLDDTMQLEFDLAA